MRRRHAKTPRGRQLSPRRIFFARIRQNVLKRKLLRLKRELVETKANNAELEKELNSLVAQLEEVAPLVSELERLIAVRTKQAITDELTALLNRRGLKERLSETSQLRERRRATIPDAVDVLVICDIDRFKQVNDTHGHEAGDIVLQVFAERLSNSIRGKERGDIAARFGGEEFIIILSGVVRDEIKDVVENIRQRTQKEPIQLPSGETLSFTSSMGATILKGEADLERASKRADLALYDAKITRDCVCLDTTEPQHKISTYRET